jgi:hypothetical protein
LKTRLSLIRSALKTRPEHLPIDHPERRAGLYVDRTCHSLVWEMREGYRWPERNADNKNSSEQPLDKDNHGPEALGRFFKGHMERFESARKSHQSSIKKRRA